MIKGSSKRKSVEDKGKSKITFYFLFALSIATFLFFMMPNYNNGDNFFSLIVVFIAYCVGGIGIYFYVFYPSGSRLEK